jgi:prophage tail gpP-like protein
MVRIKWWKENVEKYMEVNGKINKKWKLYNIKKNVSINVIENFNVCIIFKENLC